MASFTQKLSIGIDLGTCYSCVGSWQDGRIEIIANSQGSRITPSCVSFGDCQLVGEAARNQFSFGNTITNVKRLMGRQFSDPVVSALVSDSPFRIVSGLNGKASVQVTHGGTEKTFIPEEISSMVLMQLKSDAEAFLGSDVRDAVITVPAYFNDAQRTATRDAGMIAGLNVLRIINEPTAAALAYGVHLSGEDRNVLVFDLGGGTFDVSILNLDDGTFQVLAVNGDNQLGGEDFDMAILNEFVVQFKRMYPALPDIKNNARAFTRLKTACERAKRVLSERTEARIQIDNLIEGKDLDVTITRAKFEQLIRPQLNKCMRLVDACLADSTLNISNIHEVLLVGGSTRIPKVRSMLKEHFGGKEPNASLHPDEVVASGACIEAAIRTGRLRGTGRLIDVIPLSLGIDVQSKDPWKKKALETSVIIPRNSILPCRKEEIYTTTKDNQSSINIRVTQGECLAANKNFELGKFELAKIPPMPAGQPSITVTMSIDIEGMLSVTAVEQSTRFQSKLDVLVDNSKLTSTQINRMLVQMKSFNDTEKAKHLNIFAAQINSLCDQLNVQSNIPSPLSFYRGIVQTLLNTIDYFLVAMSNSTMDCTSLCSNLDHFILAFRMNPLGGGLIKLLIAQLLRSEVERLRAVKNKEAECLNLLTAQRQELAISKQHVTEFLIPDESKSLILDRLELLEQECEKNLVVINATLLLKQGKEVINSAVSDVPINVDQIWAGFDILHEALTLSQSPDLREPELEAQACATLGILYWKTLKLEQYSSKYLLQMVQFVDSITHNPGPTLGQVFFNKPWYSKAVAVLEEIRQQRGSNPDDPLLAELKPELDALKAAAKRGSTNSEKMENFLKFVLKTHPPRGDFVGKTLPSFDASDPKAIMKVSTKVRQYYEPDPTQTPEQAAMIENKKWKIICDEIMMEIGGLFEK